jgi:hypothetical protein
MSSTTDAPFLFRLYLSVVSAVTFFVLLFSATALLTLGLKTYVFRVADAPQGWFDCTLPLKESGEVTVKDDLKFCEKQKIQQEESYKIQKAQEAVRETARILMTLPLFLIHFLAFLNQVKKSRKTG